jgi:hypothetical protein
MKKSFVKTCLKTESDHNDHDFFWMSKKTLLYFFSKEVKDNFCGNNMETFGNILVAKVPENSEQRFYCEHCDYGCCKKYNWEKHLSTRKHQMKQNETSWKQKVAKVAKSGTETILSCKFCDRVFKHRSGLWKHEKNCESGCVPTFTDKELIQIFVSQNEKLMKLLETGSNNTNCNNTTNKTFNLNVYLNETCKDAMNISEFISSIHFNLEDLENTGRKGYVEGISDIFLKNLKSLEHHMRPIHCSNFKREILYIKDNNKWEKEGEEKPILTKAIKTVANENIKQIKNWRDKNPDCTSSESRKNDLYLRIVSNSMNGSTEEECKKNIHKIISNVAKEVVIDKVT